MYQTPLAKKKKHVTNPTTQWNTRHVPPMHTCGSHFMVFMFCICLKKFLNLTTYIYDDREDWIIWVDHYHSYIHLVANFIYDFNLQLYCVIVVKKKNDGYIVAAWISFMESWVWPYIWCCFKILYIYNYIYNSTVTITKDIIIWNPKLYIHKVLHVQWSYPFSPFTGMAMGTWRDHKYVGIYSRKKNGEYLSSYGILYWRWLVNI